MTPLRIETRLAHGPRHDVGGRVAQTLLAAAVAILVLDSFFPVIWAAAAASFVLAGASMFNRPAKKAWAPLGWRVAGGAIDAALPASLWLSGGAAGAVCAIALSSAFLIRNISGRGGEPLAESTPLIAGLVGAPFLAFLLGGAEASFAALAAAASGVVLLSFGAALLGEKRAAEALSRAAHDNARLHEMARMVFDTNHSATLVLDRDLRIVAISKQLQAFLETNQEQVIGWKLHDLAMPLPSKWAELVPRALAGEAVSCTEDVVTRGDGGEVFLSWECIPWRDENDAVVGLCVHSVNVTALVRERNQRHANATRLAMVLDFTEAAIWEIDVVNRTLIGADHLSSLFGTRITVDDMIALTPVICHPDDRAAVRAATNAAFVGNRRFQVEHRVYTPSGEERWVETFGEGLRDETGAPRGLLCLTLDITKRKQAELGLIDAMRKAERGLEGKQALMAAIARDIGGGGADPARMGPTAAGEDEAYTGLDEVFARLSRVLAEIDRRDNALVDAVQALRDTRSAAEAANVAKSQFLANMSHELRTPLNAVIGYAEILEEDLTLAGETHAQSAQDAIRIRTAARHLLALINEVLDLSKIEAGKMSLSATDVDVAGLIAEVSETVRPLAAEKGNTLEIVSNAGGSLHADPLRLRQCLLNLLSNACKFTSHGVVRLAVSESPDGAALIFEVSDSGIGMNAEQVSRLFRPFEQAEIDTAHKFGGTGLGLALTRRIAQLMGGDVLVASTPGVGSVFTLTLPIAAATEAPTRRDGVRLDALFIDSDPAAREFYRRVLTPFGFSVSTADSAAAGLAAVRANRPSIVALSTDVDDGWETLMKLVKDPRCGGAPVLAITPEASRRRALSAGACAVVPSPADRSVLAAAAVRYARPASSTPQETATPAPRKANYNS